MSSLRQQCDFMSAVVQRALIMGMSREQFDKLAETAWLVLTAERCFTCNGARRIDEMRLGNVVNIPCPECSTEHCEHGIPVDSPSACPSCNSTPETPLEQCSRCPEERQQGAKRCAYCGREWFDRL